MKEAPLDAASAQALLAALKAAGFAEIAFVGGDPSLRSDIGDLVRRAQSLGMRVEVQTNAHLFERVFHDVLDQVDLFGFSLDANTASAHDAFRGTVDNFSRVRRAIEMCEAANRPYVVRTVVSAVNADNVAGIGDLLKDKKRLRKWSLLEFTPIGEGFINREIYRLDRTRYLGVCADVRLRFPEIVIDQYMEEAKGGTYFLIKPNGDVYGTESFFEGETYRSVGNALRDGVARCMAALTLNGTKHAARYEKLIPKSGE